MLKIHSRYDPPPQVDYPNLEPTMTQQHFKDECDINNIMRKYQATGLLTDPLNPGTVQPQYGDFYDASDYHTAQTIIAEANQAFAQLDSSLRKRFNNDPIEMLSFLENIDNLEEAVRLGLVQAPDPAPSVVVPPVPEA